jgi:hypothetical protein
MEWSERLLALLHKPESDRDFQELLLDLKEDVNPVENTFSRAYCFDKHGFSIHVHPKRNVIQQVIFHGDSRAVRYGSYLPYAGQLPRGITRLDTRSDVHTKLGLDPYSLSKRTFDHDEGETRWDAYYIAPNIFVIGFRFPADTMILFRVNKRIEK